MKIQKMWIIMALAMMILLASPAVAAQIALADVNGNVPISDVGQTFHTPGGYVAANAVFDSSLGFTNGPILVNIFGFNLGADSMACFPIVCQESTGGFVILETTGGTPLLTFQATSGLNQRAPNGAGSLFTSGPGSIPGFVPGTATFSFSYVNYKDGTAVGNFLLSAVPTATPEPAPMALMAAALLGLWFIRKLAPQFATAGRR